MSETARITKEPITLKEIDEIVNQAVAAEAFIEIWEGVLNDNYIIYDAGGIQIDEEEPTEYIIFLAEYASTQSNNLYMIRTNNRWVVEHYENLFES